MGHFFQRGSSPPGFAFQSRRVAGAAAATFFRHLETDFLAKNAALEFLVSLHTENGQSGVLEGLGQTEYDKAEGLLGGGTEEGECNLPKSETMEYDAYNQKIDASLGRESLKPYSQTLSNIAHRQNDEIT